MYVCELFDDMLKIYAFYFSPKKYKVTRTNEKRYQGTYQDTFSPAIQNVQWSTKIMAAHRTRCVYRPFVAHLQE